MFQYFYLNSTLNYYISLNSNAFLLFYHTKNFSYKKILLIQKQHSFSYKYIYDYIKIATIF